MKVILLKDVKNVGKKFEEVEVKKGHALNFLIPQELALTATNETVHALSEERKRHQEKRHKQEKELAEKLSALGEISVILKVKANEQGHLFAGIGQSEIIEVLKDEHGIELEPEHIKLEHSIKEVGDHEIPVSVADTETTLTVSIEAEE